MNKFWRVSTLAVFVATSLGTVARADGQVAVRVVATRDASAGEDHFALSVTNSSNRAIVLEPNGTNLFSHYLSPNHDAPQPMIDAHCPSIHVGPDHVLLLIDHGKATIDGATARPIPTQEPPPIEMVLPAGSSIVYVTPKTIQGLCETGPDRYMYAVYGTLAWKFVDSSEMQSSTSAIVRSNRGFERF